MKTLKTAGIAMLIFVTGLLPAQALDIGDALVDGDVEMKNIDDATVTISGLEGDKGTLVIFSCNHCPVVKAWQDVMVDIGNTYQAKGVAVIFINSNDPDQRGDTFEGMQELAAEKGYTFPYVVDATSDVARHFGAEKTPDVFLFDADDKLVYKGAVGEGGNRPAEGGASYLTDALDALLAGKTIDPDSTRAVGCSIKFR